MQGRVVFGTLLISMGTVILAVILGLRYLAGTLGGSDALNTLTLVVLYMILVVIASLVSYTSLLVKDPPEGSPSNGP